MKFIVSILKFEQISQSSMKTQRRIFGPCQLSMIELNAKIVNDYRPLTIFAKIFSIDV